MLISQPVTSCLTNHSELCVSRLLNNQPRRISIYRLQRRPSFGFESSVSSTPMTSGDPVDWTDLDSSRIYDALGHDAITVRPQLMLPANFQLAEVVSKL